MSSAAASPSRGDRPGASPRILDAINRKRAGHVLGSAQITGLVTDFVDGHIPDYQMAAWLATVACRGMEIDEIAALTRAYAAGGTRLDLRGLGSPVVDKHSTGGVGDNVSLVVVPVVAACGVRVAKLSGRGLGHAGGTLDKLEAIDGLRLDLGAAEARSVLAEVGMFIGGQSAELAPGDKATYALRDVTATVGSIPLIAASIISKKIAVGADSLLLDVKTGAGALVPELTMSIELAETMVRLAEDAGLSCRAAITDMSQPLGFAVGNSLELKEALAVLQGAYVPGLSEVSRVLSRLMLQSADPTLAAADADDQVSKVLADGAGHEQFVRWAAAQGGKVRVLERPSLLPTARHRTEVVAKRSGWIAAVDPVAIGTAAVRVGAGRVVGNAPLDPGAGVVLQRRVGDRVDAGSVLAEVHYTRGGPAAAELVRTAFTIGEQPVSVPPTVHRIL